MGFPTFDTDQLVEGQQWIHPVTGTHYRLGPNGVWQKFRPTGLKQDDLERLFVTKPQFNADQGRQDNQINAVETKVELLAQARAVGKWKYNRTANTSVRPPLTKGFYGTNKSGVSDVLLNWQDLNLLMIDKTDLDGTQHEMVSFKDGDKIEVFNTNGSDFMLGTITSAPTQESYGNAVISIEHTNGGPKEDDVYLISVYPPGSGMEVDMDALDNRYIVKTGDEISGNLTFTKGVGTVWHDNAGNKMGTLHRASNNTIQYTASNGKAFKITGKDAGGTAKTFIDVQNTDSTGTEGTDYALHLYHVASPTSDYHGVNRKYVDNKCQEIADKITSPIRTWKYKPGGGNPGSGEFTVSGENYIRIHHTTHKGMDLVYSSGFYEDLNDGSTHFAKVAFTAWKHTGGKAMPMYFIWAGWFNDTSSYFEIKDLSSTDKTDLGLEGTQEYELHFAGFF